MPILITPTASSFAGILLGLAVLFYRLFLGKVLGISGIFNATLQGTRKRDSLWQSFFILGLIAAGIVENNSFTIGPHSNLFLIVSGSLVGFGTKLGNGCTSGHGLCGLSRLSKRSWIAVPSFMLSGMAVRMWNFKPSHDSKLLVDTSLSHPLASLLLLSSLLVFGVVYQSSKWIKSRAMHFITQDILSLYFGFVFGVALSMGGMCNPQKVLDFLAFPTLFIYNSYHYFDPSLLFVMGFGFLPNLVVNGWINRNFREPLLFKKWELPTRTDVDWKLVVGALAFGAGWGMCGLCPGPAIVTLSRVLNGEYTILKWMVGYYIGNRFARIV